VPLLFESTATGSRSSAKPAERRGGSHEVIRCALVDDGAAQTQATEIALPPGAQPSAETMAELPLRTRLRPRIRRRPLSNQLVDGPGDEDVLSDDDATPRPDYIRYPKREICTNPWDGSTNACQTRTRTRKDLLALAVAAWQPLQATAYRPKEPAQDRLT
jgi:hypothetical protein